MINKCHLITVSQLSRAGFVFWEEGSFCLRALSRVQCTSRLSKMVEALKEPFKRRAAASVHFGCFVFLLLVCLNK